MSLVSNVTCKAKLVNRNEWVEGYFIKSLIGDISSIYLLKENYDAVSEHDKTVYHNVDSNTLCRAIGCTDRNGHLLYEHDIITMGLDKYAIRWNKEQLRFDFYSKSGYPVAGCNLPTLVGYCSLIGNEIDNPELLD